MANAKIVDMKAKKVDEVAQKLRQAQSVVVFDYRGITVEEDTQLCSDMRKANVEYVVLKNSIVERASKAAEIDESINGILKGPSAFAFGHEDEVAPAKILKDFIKKAKKCELKGGIVQGNVVDAKGIETLADLPSREQLLARMLGSLMSSVRGLAVVLDQIAKTKEAE